jgi:hypothetical protein
MKPAQFNLRQLLMAVLACSAVFAIAAPLLRGFPEPRLIWMGLALVACAATTCLAMLRLIHRRQQFEASAGKILLEVRQPTRGSGLILACAAAIEVLIIVATAIGGVDAMGTVAPLFMAVCVPPTWSRAAILYVWKIGEETLEICQHALIVGGLAYYPWEQVKSYAWSEVRCPPVLLLVLDDQIVGAVVPLEKRQQIEALLAANVAPADRHDPAGIA